jgi:murein L,D-transpeptidase YcbB/YkuD
MRAIAVFIPLLLMAGHAAAVEPDPPTTLISKSEAFGITIEDQLARKTRAGRFYEGMLGFYKERNGEPLWLRGQEFDKKASEARAAMAHAAEFGLDPAAFNPPVEITVKRDAAYPAEALAKAEADMSLAVVTYATEAQSGRFRPQDLGESVDPTPDVPSPERILQGIAEVKGSVRTYLEKFNPQHPQFIALKDRLDRLPPGSPQRKLLLVNMERWRWLPRQLGNTYVRINMPEFLVRLVRNDQVVFEEKIVIGSLEHKTPIMSEKMQTVVFNPYWNVPGSIAVRELLPRIQQNPAFLERNGLQVFYKGRATPVDPYYMNWEAINPDDILLRQEPGQDNALGNLKFLFPNKHDVYMHDTPAQHLFDAKVRAFSHGCMRVHDPSKFASAILQWPLQRVQNAIATGGQNDEVPVEPRLPVYVMYFTAWVEPGGELRTFVDIYGHDSEVAQALRLEPAVAAKPSREHPVRYGESEYPQGGSPYGGPQYEEPQPYPPYGRRSRNSGPFGFPQDAD